MDRLNIGVDWGHEHSQFVAEDAQGHLLWKQRCSTRELPDTLQHLRALAAEHPGASVHVAIERKSGRLVESLLAAGFTLWLAQPQQVDLARTLRFASLAKDDLRDARTMAWMLRAMPEGLTRIEPPSERYRPLQRTTRMRTDLVAERTAVLAQVLELFREQFPEMLQICGPEVRWFTALWRRVRTPEGARHTPADEIRAVLRTYRVRKISVEQIVAIFAASTPCTPPDDWALQVELTLDRLELLETQIGRVEERIAEQLASLQAVLQTEQGGPTDVEIVQSLPGAGAQLTPRLLGEQLHERVRADLEWTRVQTGVAPVRRTTGKRQTRGEGQVAMRRACNEHLRNALHLLVEKGMQHDPWMKQRYATLRARNHTHGRACRQMADGLLHRLRAMLRDRVLYQPPALQVDLAS